MAGEGKISDDFSEIQIKDSKHAVKMKFVHFHKKY